MDAEREDNSSFWSKKLFTDFWNEPESAAESGAGRPKVDSKRLGWIIAGAAMLLVLAVSLVAIITIRRGEKAMAGLLAEKGASLLMVFESALRTGMRGQSGLQIQTLLEEITQSPDLIFVAVTMPDGVIIAHSEKSRLGEILRMEGEGINGEKLAQLAPGATEKWKIIRMEGRRVFLLYRHFTMGDKNWSPDVPEPTIFLGMDVSPFEITNSQNRGYIAMLSLVALLAGLAGLLVLWYAQRAAESAQKRIMAESEVHRLEAEIQRKEKLAAVGTLAAGVAHEIRNPLSSIKGYATYFSQRFPEGSDDREAAAVMVREVNRLNRVITDLLGLSRPGDVDLKPVALENVAAHTLRLIRRNAASRNVTLHCRLARRIPDIMADMERISQAVLNLCLNALEAMPNGGDLTIAVAGGKKRVCLMVKDTGIGMAPEIQAKIFDPYFTTKGNGTGLGLPTVHKIVTAHHGQIEVVSRQARPGVPGGTIFRIWFKAA